MSKKITIVCKTCSQSFQKYSCLNSKYCSKKCSQVGQITKFSQKCQICENEFISHKSSKRKYCSSKCAYARPSTRKIKEVQPKIPKIPKPKRKSECQHCLKLFEHIKKEKRTYCSVPCMAEGYKTTLIGENNPNFGNGAATRKAHERGAYKNRNFLGENNPNFGNRGNVAAAILRGCYDNKPLPKFSLGKICEYKGFTMRSSWEYEYAKYLDNLGIKWEYEQKRFKLSSGKLYIPDFYLPDQDKYVEIKGHWFPKAIEKFKIFKEEYPHINLEVIDKEIWKN